MKASWSEKLFTNQADFSTLASFTAEASLLGGSVEQPVFPPLFFDGLQAIGRTVRVEASGVFSVTGTPTWTFQTRLSTSAGSAVLSGASVGVSAAITAGSGVTNQLWRLVLDLTARTPGQGTGNLTLVCDGKVESAGFATLLNPLSPTTPPTATWTQSFDASLLYFLNLSVACSASSASNTITCKKLLVTALD